MHTRHNLDVRFAPLPDNKGWKATFDIGGRTDTREISRDALVDLDLPSLFEGTGLEVEQRLRQRGLRLGNALTTWLMGDAGQQAGWLNKLVGNLGTNPTVAALQADLALYTNDPLLLQQPWHALAWADVSLLEHRWTVRMQRHQDGAPPVEFPDLPAILLILPKRDPSLETATHEEELRELLRRISPVLAHPDSTPTARTRRELLSKLKQRAWDVLYFYGHGVMEPNPNGAPRTALRLDSARDDLASEDMSVRELRNAILDEARGRPALVYLNCCAAGGGGWSGAGELLDDVVGVVFAHHGPVASDVATARARDVLEAVLGRGVDPVQAFCDSALREGANSPVWMAGTVHMSASGWTAKPRGDAAVSRDSLWPYRLDRRPHRALLVDEVRAMVQRPHSAVRGTCFLAVGGRNDCIDTLGPVMREHLQESLREIPVLSLRATLPPFTGSQPVDPAALDAALRAALQRGDTVDLTTAVRQRASELVDARGGFVVWTEFDAWPEEAGAIPPRHAMNWAVRCADWTKALSSIPEARFVWWLSADLGSGAYSQFEQLLQDPRARRARTAPASTVLLPPLQGVTVADLYDFLRDHEPELLSEDWWSYARRIHVKGVPRDGGLAPYAEAAEVLKAVREAGSWAKYRGLPDDPDSGFF
jgi:hypothetical protein